MARKDQLAEGYSKPELDIIKLYNSIVMEKQVHENSQAFQEQLNQKLLEQTNVGLKSLELQLEASRTAMRPHKLYGADVYYSAHEGKYICKLPFFHDEDEEMETPICAYGDTPAEACDNFDYQWIHSEK